MFRNTVFAASLTLSCIALCGTAAYADSSTALVTEDFTGKTTTNQWYFFNGACLTASTAPATTASGPGTPPGCTKDSYYTENLVGGYYGTSGSSQTLPDPSGYGALRFTNGCIYNSDCGSGGHSQNGAIISANSFSTSQGLDITFKTMTYRGDSRGANQDGADGMSFFLMAGDATPNIGSWGGSLGYTCSNANPDYHGMIGAYLGLGIDEYGNFLNGVSNTLGESGTSASGDNTASGGGYQPNRIGMRGGGSVAWPALSTNPATAAYLTAYSSSSDTNYAADQMNIVKNTCASSYLTDPSGNPILDSTGSKIQVADYPAIPNAYTVISSKIANEYSTGGYSSLKATPITYRLRLAQNGLLSLDYSYNGGAWTHVLQNQAITASNGAFPSTVRFGFAGSTGGSSNIHEILCFKATPETQAASSTTVNQQQSSKVQSGSQAYFGYYDPTDWTGRLTANSLLTDSSGHLTIAATANWDASCSLSGIASGSACPTTGQAGPAAAQPWQASSPGGRVMLTWSGTAGIPLEWTSLTSAEQSALDSGDATQTANRLTYLRGDRSNEIPTTGPLGSQIYRDRDSVLGDIVDSSSTWVGPPSKSVFSAYESPMTWKDKLYPTVSMAENSGQRYDQYAQADAARLNVVYVGANDGMVHGFSAGAYDSTGSVYNNTSNTGQEVLAYMPQSVLTGIHSSSSSQIDYANAQYGHAFYVDATPGTGDLYYNGAWHTWLVGGLGSGGAEIYALDITSPSSFTESSASSLVVGDWTASSIQCTNPSTNAVGACANSSGQSYLGNTYGTPQVRRLHNGTWGVIFGNGTGSASGDAGIFVLTVSPTGAETMYYLSTQVSGSNGIAYVTPVDMDSDHVVDYVYAGDLRGNVWRFDLTSSNPASWGATPGPIFKTPSGQPITTAIQPDFVTGPVGSSTQLMLFFGTGEKFPLTNSSAVSYQSGTQYFYGVWDWNMSAWDAHNSSQFASVSAATVGTLTSLTSPYTLGNANLQSQAVSIDAATGDRLVASANSVCWAGTSTCSGGSSANKAFGWYLRLPGTNTAYSATSYEQVVYNPMIVSTAVVFNSILPAVDSPLMCTPDHDKGWTYALDVRTGGPVPNFFVNPGTSTTTSNLNTLTIGFEGDASGSSSQINTTNSGTGATNSWLIFQSTNGGPGTPIQIQPGANISGSRQTWIQLR